MDFLENRTLSEIADDATTAYINSQYTFVTTTVYDGNTGLPIEGASVQVYNDWSAFYYEYSPEYFSVTDFDGTTDEFQLEQDAYFYTSVSAPGYSTV